MNRSSDVVIIGGGIIGVSLALQLNRLGASVRVLERGEPGREASWAGAGMLAWRDPDAPECLQELMAASAQIYPEWVERIEELSGLKADLRREGTIYISSEQKHGAGNACSEAEISRLEPNLRSAKFGYLTDEGSVDPRALLTALIAAAKCAGVAISHEHPVSDVEVVGGRATGVRCGKKSIAADVTVNCAGAWAGEVRGAVIPAKPVKGHMLSLVKPSGGPAVLKHVVRGDEVYLVPRSDGRILIGATVEDAGFDKRVVPETILKLRNLAAELVPEIRDMQIHESWTGLRPGSPDKLPILGETAIKNYFVAGGHYRNGILLAPITAAVMAAVINGDRPGVDVSRFSLKRFAAE